jgi:hypothetical protein
VLLQNLPQCMVNMVNSDAFRRRRLEMEDGGSSFSSRSTSRPSRLSRSRLTAGTCLDSAYLSDDGVDPKSDAGCKVLTDDDGRVRVFASAAARATRKDMKAYWRLMADTKIDILLPDNCFDTATWESAIAQYMIGHPPVGCHPDRKSFFMARVLRESLVCTDPTTALRARTLHWVADDWVTMSILYFLLNPGDLTGVDLARSSDQQICALLVRAIEGWNLWMHAFFDHRYNQAFPQVLGWLRTVNRDTLPLHSGYHLRYLVETLFYSFYNAITAGGSPTRFGDVNFSQPEAAWRLMLALDSEFVETVVVRDPSPHPWFQKELKARVILGCPISRNGGQPLPPPSSALSAVSAPPPPVVAVPAASPSVVPSTKSAHPCPFHVAFLLQVQMGKGPLPPCQYQSACYNVHRPLSEFTVSAIEGGMGSIKMSPLREAILAAVHDPANLHRFL